MPSSAVGYSRLLLVTNSSCTDAQPRPCRRRRRRRRRCRMYNCSRQAMAAARLLHMQVTLIGTAQVSAGVIGQVCLTGRLQVRAGVRRCRQCARCWCRCHWMPVELTARRTNIASLSRTCVPQPQCILPTVSSELISALDVIF